MCHFSNYLFAESCRRTTNIIDSTCWLNVCLERLLHLPAQFSHSLAGLTAYE